MKPAAVFVAFALIGIAIAQFVVLRRQDARIRELETSHARQSTPEGAAEILRRAGIDPATAAAGDSSAANTAAATRAAAEAAISEQTAALEHRLASLEKSMAASNPNADPAILDAAVAKKVDEKMGEQGKKKKGGLFGEENKRPLADVSKDLALTELQEDLVAEAINASQKSCFDIITTPRNDGTNVLDDVVLAFQDPEHAEEKMKAAFMQIFTAKIPGSDETYLAKIMTEKNAVNESLKKILTPEQMKKYERLGQDPHEIQTGYDPYGAYMAERLGKK